MAHDLKKTTELSHLLNSLHFTKKELLLHFANHTKWFLLGLLSIH